MGPCSGGETADRRKGGGWVSGLPRARDLAPTCGQGRVSGSLCRISEGSGGGMAALEEPMHGVLYLPNLVPRYSTGMWFCP